MVTAWQCLANTCCLIAYAIYGRILESEKRFVITNAIIDLLCLCEHNICEAKFISVGSVTPASFTSYTEDLSQTDQYLCVWLCLHIPLNASQGQL